MVMQGGCSSPIVEWENSRARLRIDHFGPLAVRTFVFSTWMAFSS